MTSTPPTCRLLALLLLLVVSAHVPAPAAAVVAESASQPMMTTAAPESPAAAADTTMQRRLTRRPVTGGEEPQGGVRVVNAAGDTIHFASRDSVRDLNDVEILVDVNVDSLAYRSRIGNFNPDPKRALWLSALCPGLGQIYNRRYWKLPIVVGAFVGLAYATSWNNRMLNDYTRAYRDATDKDPSTRSYMDFYPPTVKESELDMEWLQRALRNKKNYYRRYRDLCIIGMVGMYALCIIDAYVDASLAHFDVSPDLSLQVRPAVVDPGGADHTPALGMRCAITF